MSLIRQSSPGCPCRFSLAVSLVHVPTTLPRPIRAIQHKTNEAGMQDTVSEKSAEILSNEAALTEHQMGRRRGE